MGALNTGWFNSLWSLSVCDNELILAQQYLKVHLIEPFFFSSSLYLSQRFIQYLASRNTLFNLNNFLDKGALQGK